MNGWNTPLGITVTKPVGSLRLSEADDYSYVSVPASRMFYVKTRYIYAGKGMPRPYDLDDE